MSDMSNNYTKLALQYENNAVGPSFVIKVCATRFSSTHIRDSPEAELWLVILSGITSNVKHD